MDELITRSLEGRATAEEERRLTAWRNAKPENEERYHDVAQVWQLTSLVERPQLASASPPRRLSPARRTPGLDPVSWWRRTLPWAVAATAVLGLGATLWQVRGSSKRHIPELKPAVYITGADERQSISLGDGTVVRLAPDSRLQVLDVPDAREVWLEGRAFFVVAKQAGRPFKVRARSGVATVLGTQFELQARDQRLDLFVTEGRVALSGATKAVRVEAAQRSSVIDGEPTVAEPVPDVRSALAWMGTFLVLDGVNLEAAASELTRVYGVRVELLPGAPSKRLVTGWFSDQSLVEVVSAICLVVKASCSVQDSVVTIGR